MSYYDLVNGGGYESLPDEVVTQVFIDGDWEDITDLGVRAAHALKAPKPNEPAQYAFLMSQVGGALLVDEERAVRVWYPPYGGGVAYKRLFKGWIKQPNYSVLGGQTLETAFQAVGPDSWMEETPYQLEARLTIGYTPWLPEHPFQVNEHVAPGNGKRFKVHTAGTTGATRPDFDQILLPGEYIEDGTIEWEPDGSSYITDVEAWEQILPEYWGAEGTNITWSNLNVLIADVGIFEIEAGTPFLDVVEAMKALAGSSTFDPWEASTAYELGALIESSPSNGRYYRNIQAGTTGVNPDLLHDETDIGDEITDGGSRWVCMGPTSVLPQQGLVIPEDNVAHDASWMEEFVWYDLNNATHTPTLSAEYWTGNEEDATHIGVEDMQLTRESSETANIVYVFGDPDTGAASGELIDTGRVTHDGRRRSRVFHVPELLSNEECVAIGNQILGKLNTRETLTAIAREIDLVVFRGGVRKAAFTNELFGLSSTPYALKDISMSMSSELAVYTIQAGAGFLDTTDDVLQTQLAGRKYIGPSAPPQPVTWEDDPGDPNYFLVDNTPDPKTETVSPVVQWLSGHENNLAYFHGYITIDGGPGVIWLPPTYWPRQSIMLPPLPQDVDVVVSILAVNNNGQFLRDPLTGEPVYSHSPSFTTGLYVSEPPTGLAIDTTRGQSGYYFINENQARIYITYTPPAVDPDHYVFTLWPTADPTDTESHIFYPNAHNLLMPMILNVGTQYDAELVAVVGSHVSTPAGMAAFTVPAYGLTDAPTINSVTSHRDAFGEAYVKVTVTQAANHAGGGWLTADPTGTGFEVTIPLPPNFGSPSVFIMKDVVEREEYDFVAVTVDNLGFPSAPSAPVTHTVNPDELLDRPLNLDYEVPHPVDPTLPEYWTRTTPGNSQAVLDDTEFKRGMRSIKLVHGTGATNQTPSIVTHQFLTPLTIGAVQELTGWVKGDAGGETLFVELTLYDSAGSPLYSEDVTQIATTDWAPFRLQHTVFQPDVHSAIIEIFEFDSTTSAKTIYVDTLDWHPVGSQVEAGYIDKGRVSKLDDLSDQVSLIDRARIASGWRNLGLLTNDAFREASIVWWDGDYYVFSTQVYETDLTRVHVASTLEGIVAATPTDDLAPVKYPSAVYDPTTGVWHLWGSASALTEHYTAPTPTGPYTYSDTISVPIFDATIARHPISGKWHAIGFQNGVWTLQVLVADFPEGPWTNLGDPFGDVGHPPYANLRPDPGFAFTGNRDYIFFSGAPTTVLTQNYFPSICEINLTTGRVIGVPVALLDEREEWMVGGEPLHTRGISDLIFLRVPGEPDRIFAFANDGEVSTTDDWGWGCIELGKTIAPTDGRKHTDLVRIDFKRGVDLALNIRPVTRTGAEWRENGLVITAEDGGAHGYLAQQYIDDFTMYADFTVDGPQAANAMVGVILGPTYAAGPAITIDLDGDDIRGVVQASDDTAVVLTSGITTVPGRRYRVMLRRASDVVTLWVDGVLVDTDTLDPVITDARVWSMGSYITLTEPEVYPFIGTIHEFWCTAQALPMQELAVYSPPTFVGARYKTAAGQSIPNVTATIVDFDTADYDPLEAVTTGASWKFTAPVAGFYRVGGMITFVTSAGWALSESADLDLYKNGSRVCNLDRNDNVANGNVIKTLSGCTEIYLLAGEYIDLRAFQQSGASLALFNDGANNYVTVSRIG